MSAIETALFKLGVSVANSFFASWLRAKTPGARPNETLTELIRRRTPDAIQRRKAKRQVEIIADQVIEHLQEFLRTEFGSVAENEVAAAVELVNDLFGYAERDAKFLLSLDLDAVRVDQYLRESGKDKISAALLSAGATLIFDRVIRETSAYIVEFFSVMPDFNQKTFAEILRKQSMLESMFAKVLERLPAAGVQASDRAPEDVSFETDYRRAMARKFDRLELFGATLSEYSRRYTLSVAYISLTVTGRHTASDKASASENSSAVKSGGKTFVTDRRIEQVLGYGHQRVLIRGEAGSGKTTLLQWLAVTASRREFRGEMTAWNDLVPVYIPLRRFASRQLPRPEQFLEFVLPNLSGTMPHGWMNRLFKSGRALLLLDGLDELQAQDRIKMTDWFRELAGDFSKMSVIFTSRPTATEEGWLSGQGVQSFELQPMSLPDIKSLIDHWHSAMEREAESDEERQELIRYRENLKSVVEDQRSIRTLATNPLMCALMCALHRDRRAHLPGDRMELYDIALEMLLDRRDKEREVQDPQNFLLTRRQKQEILEDIAYWLVRNGQSDATIRAAATRIRRILSHIPQIGQGPTAVLTYLLERSGVLRSPVEGRIDFLHRTFQEYLAAKAAIDGGDIPALIAHACNDQWREVIILAAGYARPTERETLIKALLNLGKSDDANRSRLYLLAVACLETVARLSPKLRSEAQEALAVVVPPGSHEAAAAIAAAGDLAIPYLTKSDSFQPQETIGMCVRTLALIGGDDAMRVLKGYASERRSLVAREIVRAWTAFPAEEYAREILTVSPLENGIIQLPDASYISYVRFLRSARTVLVDRANKEQLRELGSYQHLRHLGLAGINTYGFDWLTNSRLTELVLTGSAIDAWDGIEGAANLRYITLNQCSGSLSGSLSGLNKLRGLTIHASEIRSLQFLGEAAPRLESLEITECAFLPSLRGISACTGLQTLTVGDNINIFDIAEMTRHPVLQTVTIRGAYMTDLRPLLTLPNLKVVRLDTNESYRGLAQLRSQADLTIRFLRKRS